MNKYGTSFEYKCKCGQTRTLPLPISEWKEEDFVKEGEVTDHKHNWIENETCCNIQPEQPKRA